MYRLSFALLLTATCALASDDIQYIADQCRDCHRPDQTRGVMPLLDGQHAAYLEAQLARFRDSHRQSFPMEGIAAALDNVQIEALAAHFAAQPASRHSASVRTALIEHGRARAEALRCIDCHGEAFEGGGAIPRLGNQAPQYLEAQLVGIREGRRYHPPTAIGARIGDLDDIDLRALAHFISSQN